VPEAKKFAPVASMNIAKMPEYLANSKPPYPEKLKGEEIEGSVKIKIGIDKSGNVVSAKIISSDHPLFSEAALKFVKTCKFKPAILANGQPVDTEIPFTIKFELEEF